MIKETIQIQPVQSVVEEGLHSILLLVSGETESV